MNNNKRYYWIKLKTDFFTQNTIDFLLSQKNGCEYVVLYQMLCLLTANNDGTLATRFGETLIPYDIDKIVRDTKYFDFDTVTIALGLFKKLGLIYEQQEKILRVSDFEQMVGSETVWAEKKRKYREAIKGNNERQLLGHNEDIVREEKDIDIEIDKDIDIEEEKEESVSVSVSKTDLNNFFKRFEIKGKLNQETIINYLKKGMTLEVIENGLLIPFDRNVMNFDFDKEEAPIGDAISYGLTILENWDNFGVKTMDDVKKYNKLNKNREVMLGSDNGGDK